MLEAHSRTLLFFNAVVKPHHEKVPHIPLDGILREVEASNNTEAFVSLIENKAAAVRLIDIEVDESKDVATLLVGYADTRGADPVFAHLEKGTLREEPKLDGEGVAVSAHLVFKLTPDPQSGLYSAILEDVPGIGRTKLEPFLRKAMKNASSYKFKGENGNEKSTWPVTNLIINQSSDLASSLNSGGSIMSVELTRYNSTSSFDKLDNVTEKKTTTTIKIDGKPSGEKATKMLNDIKSLAISKEYVDMRVIWHQPSEGQKSVRMGTAREDAGDALFGRIMRISTDCKLPQCSTAIITEVRDKMVAELI